MNPLYIVLIILITATIIYLLVCGIFKKCNKCFETFQVTSSNLDKVRNDLRILLEQTVNYDITNMYNSTVNLDPDTIVNCVHKTMKLYKLPLTDFSMDGDQMDKPILDMYQNNPKVYQILGKCKFLELVGKIIAIAAWISNNGDKSQDALFDFLKCIHKINWSDIQVWKNMSDSHGILLSCI